jgi:hypothetical protein
MSEAELRDLVDWTVEDAPAGARIARVANTLLRIASTVATLGADANSGAHAPTWTLPADPEAFVDIGIVRLSGRNPWLPGGSVLIRATRTDAWTTTGRADRPSRRVPLEELRIIGATPATGSGHPRHARAPWQLALADGSDQRLTLDGAWLALAWIGHLADWPEPT